MQGRASPESCSAAVILLNDYWRFALHAVETLTRSAIFRKSPARLLAGVSLHAGSASEAACTAKSTSAESALGMLPMVDPVLHSHR